MVMLGWRRGVDGGGVGESRSMGYVKMSDDSCLMGREIGREKRWGLRGEKKREEMGTQGGEEGGPPGETSAVLGI